MFTVELRGMWSKTKSEAICCQPALKIIISLSLTLRSNFNGWKEWYAICTCWPLPQTKSGRGLVVRTIPDLKNVLYWGNSCHPRNWRSCCCCESKQQQSSLSKGAARQSVYPAQWTHLTVPLWIEWMPIMITMMIVIMVTVIRMMEMVVMIMLLLRQLWIRDKDSMHI